MAYVVPNTTIQFFRAIGINPSYDNSLYFESEAAKTAYFDALVYKSAPDCTYQREHRNFVRVEIPISQMYDVDYMRFKNTNFENKWFYAFVISVNYINNITTEVEYQFDPLVTWMGIFNLKQCYVERQHTITDVIGGNVVDEGLATGEYVDEQRFIPFDASTLNIIIAYMNPDEVSSSAGMHGGVYSGCAIRSFTTAEAANTFIQELVDQNLADNIVNIYMFPPAFSTPTAGVNNPVSQSFSYEKPYHDLMGYVPKNKKMYCYPYKFVEVDNQEGQTQDYQYEYFNTTPPTESSGNFQFSVLAQTSAMGAMMLYPTGYKQATGQDVVPHQTISINHYPTCSWGVDSYQAYVAQKNATYQLDLTTGAISGAAKGATGGAIKGGATGAMVGAMAGFLTNTIGTIAENMALNASSPTMPTTSKGSQGTDVLAGDGLKGFVISEKCITPEYAEMIDNFFTMFGYAVRRVTTPRLNARPHFTYVKTVGCEVGGFLPAEDAKEIGKIIDNGCRFWKNHNEIGQYQVDNSAE